MIITNSLNSDDTIGIFAPAGSYSKSDMMTAISDFEKLGFRIKTADNLFCRYGYLAGTDKQRADDFNSLISDDNVKALIAFRGGYGSMNILKYIDIDNILKHPKPICGFSDITALINYITDKTSLVTFHGPMINSNFNDKTTLLSLQHSLSNPGVFSFNFSSLKTYNDNNVTGKLAGGNLSTICSCLGTPYEIDFNDKILLLEDINEDPYKIDRMLSQLILSGRLDKCAGFIIGYMNYSNTGHKLKEFDFSFERVIENLLVPLKKPVIYGCPFGHSYPNITMPIGLRVMIDFKDKIIKRIDS